MPESIRKILNRSTASACRRKSLVRCISVVLLLLAASGATQARALSLKLDSIAEWGKFPRFCVNTYRWGSNFFNSYDSTYVEGSGKLFNVKSHVESWTDTYDFRFQNGSRMDMLSHPTTSLGFYLTYMAVSVGYDMNMGRLFGGESRARQKFNFQFNCSLFAVDYYFIHNDVGTTIRSITTNNENEKLNLDFSGIDTRMWGVDLYYFFNHKHYSQAAAFAYSKIQKRSSGSPYAGLSFWGQDYKFDFQELADIKDPDTPISWNYKYNVKNKNYAFKVGYGYNWVFKPGFALCVSEAPSIGIRVGYINNPNDKRTTLSLINRARLSLVYNHKKRWFFGFVGNFDANLIYDKEHTLISNNLTFDFSAGYRFNIW